MSQLHIHAQVVIFKMSRTSVFFGAEASLLVGTRARRRLLVLLGGDVPSFLDVAVDELVKVVPCSLHGAGAAK